MGLRLNDTNPPLRMRTRVILGIAATIATLTLMEAAPDRVTIDSPRIEEDDPRWDCRTMGNRICGEVAP